MLASSRGDETDTRSDTAEALQNAESLPAGEFSVLQPRVNRQARKKRILLLTAPECQDCADALKRLEAVGGPFDLLRRCGWQIGTQPENHVQIIDRSGPIESDISQIVARLQTLNAPVVVFVEDGEISRSFQSGCTTPLDQWTFGWLMTGHDERPAPFLPQPITVTTSGNYPLRGNHWSVDGNPSPTRSKSSIIPSKALGGDRTPGR